VPTANPNLEDESESQRVVSPFARTTSTVQVGGGGNSNHMGLWIVSGLLALTLVGIIGYFSFRYLEDPYRTLEQFPMDKYLSDYRSLAGAKFKADLKVSADLGYKPETGRLMVFTVQSDSNNRPLVVLIPQNLSGIYFTKGQNYLISMEVREGGLVYADTCEKE
jgi:hypothetical protein